MPTARRYWSTSSVERCADPAMFPQGHPSIYREDLRCAPSREATLKMKPGSPLEAVRCPGHRDARALSTCRQEGRGVWCRDLAGRPGQVAAALSAAPCIQQLLALRLLQAGKGECPERRHVACGVRHIGRWRNDLVIVLASSQRHRLTEPAD